jgi:CheY-like chemotaxis protein
VDHKNLLIIDDDRDTVAAFQTLLERRGYGVAVATSVDEALALSGLRQFDLVLCDICFPTNSGYSFIGPFRKLSAAPVLAMSGRGQPDDREATIAAGFHAFLQKPFLVDDLVRAIEGALTISKLPLN